MHLCVYPDCEYMMKFCFFSPSAVPCRHRRYPAKWSCGCSHSAPRKDGWLCLDLGGPPVDNTHRKRGRQLSTTSKKNYFKCFGNTNQTDEQIRQHFPRGTMKPTEKTTKWDRKKRKSCFTFKCKSYTDCPLLVRMKGVSDQTSRCVIKRCPIMATGLLQSWLKLN